MVDKHLGEQDTDQPPGVPCLPRFLWPGQVTRRSEASGEAGSTRRVEGEGTKEVRQEESQGGEGRERQVMGAKGQVRGRGGGEIQSV